MADQTALFRGVYEFDDLSGCLLAARVPQTGTADLYDGTRILVRPNQQAIFVHNGQIADVFGPGNHEIKTGNVPLLTKLANWKFGFKSPLRCEIWFFSSTTYVGRRWGTAKPVMTTIETLGTIGVRGFGNFSVRIQDAKAFLLSYLGSRSSAEISELDEYIQGQLVELLPASLKKIREPKDLSSKQDEISRDLERALNAKLKPMGLVTPQIQILSLLPPDKVLQAIDEKVAMNIIGDPKQYLLYKMANSLEAVGKEGGDPSQLMMTLMLGKGLVGNDYHSKEQANAGVLAAPCAKCRKPLAAGAKFCADCGTKVGV